MRSFKLLYTIIKESGTLIRDFILSKRRGTHAIMACIRIAVGSHGGTCGHFRKNRPAEHRCQFGNGHSLRHYGPVSAGCRSGSGKFSELGEILVQKKALSFIVLSGIAGALSWLFYFLALKYGKVSQVGPIDKLSVVIAVILAFVFLGEKISWINAAGVALIAVGALLVAVK